MVVVEQRRGYVTRPSLVSRTKLQAAANCQALEPAKKLP